MGFHPLNTLNNQSTQVERSKKKNTTRFVSESTPPHDAAAWRDAPRHRGSLSGRPRNDQGKKRCCFWHGLRCLLGGFLVQFVFRKNLWLFFWHVLRSLFGSFLSFLLSFCWEDVFLGMFKPSKIIKDIAYSLFDAFFVDYPAALLTTFLLLHFFFRRIYLPVSETLHGWISWGFKRKQPDTPQSHREKVKTCRHQAIQNHLGCIKPCK